MSDAAWAIDWRDRTWTSHDLTGEHTAVVAELLGIAPSWDWFNPVELHPALGPLQMMALIAAFTIVADDVQGAPARQAVLAALKGNTVDELVAAIKLP